MKIEKKPLSFIFITVKVILIGTIITTFLPLFLEKPQKAEGVKPYTPLQLAGRDVYIREGCNNCHTQTIRPLTAETLRYGEPSKIEEFIYDRPFLWGSRRTGPDLARIGGKYPDKWHYQHMDNPRSIVPFSNMPSYKWLAQNKLDIPYTEKKMKALNLPYEAKDIEDLKGKTEMDAMVAYLQRLGIDESKKKGLQTSSVALKNPYPKGDAKAIHEGEDIYKINCKSCHGEKGKGGIGPPLTGKLKFGENEKDLYTSVADGKSGGMPGFTNQLKEKKIWQVVSYLLSLR